MKFLVVGLGSMGKRRIRCLAALGHTELRGFDLREDRRAEAMEKYGVQSFSDFEQAMAEFDPDALIISLPPAIHHIYMKEAVQCGKHFFVEASVLDTDFDEIAALAREKGVVAAPSSTMAFHPAVRAIMQTLRSGRLGKLSNFLYHSGQYLPDWHPYESVSEFYVSNPLTGGAREIVPFELTWLCAVFGMPVRVFGNVRKTIEIKGAEKIDDTYNILLDYKDFLGTLTVDVVSRFATRRLCINGDKAQLTWDWNDGAIRVYDPQADAWEDIPYSAGTAAEGYNENIGENMYVDELNAFIQAAQGGEAFPNTLAEDGAVLRLLYAAEEADRQGRAVEMG